MESDADVGYRMTGSIRALIQEPPIIPPENQTLEMRVIALETKLRHSKPEHPCDCKYELSILEEKLGTLQQHPWEHRLAKIELKQRRDGVDLSRLFNEFQEVQEKTETLLEDYNWDYDNKGDFKQVIKSTNIVHVVEQMLEKMKVFDRYKAASEDCLRALKRCFEELKNEVGALQPWVIDDMVECQENVADELVELRGKTTKLKRAIAELTGSKEETFEDLQIITDKFDRRVGLLEDTVAQITKYGMENLETVGRETFYSGSSSERSVWVPPTSSRPVGNIPYTHNIPMILEQPEGWGDIRAQVCRDLEESQEAYYSSQQPPEENGHAGEDCDEELGGVSIREDLEIVDMEVATPKKKAKKKRNRARRRVPTIEDLIIEQNDMDIERHDDNIILPELTIKTEEPAEPTIPPLTIIDSKKTPEDMFDINDNNLGPTVEEQVAKTLLSKKSKSSLRKSKSKNITKGNSGPKYVPLDAIFKQGKRDKDEKGIGKSTIDMLLHQSEGNRLAPNR
ncbi:hypothetical protein ABW20_dc0103071 [Dactylellina cionopaga]|nr:hypothetical protein ABW20_dc0103071 [Dactylellina cionopaga]